MDTLLTLMLDEALLGELGEGLDSVADRLVPIYDGWQRMGVDTTALDHLGSVLRDLGWWRGRIDAALQPSVDH